MRNSSTPLALLAAAASLVAGASSLVLAQAAADKPTAAGTYKVDPVHSSAVFRVQHANAGIHWGRINDPAGTVTVAADGAPALDVTLALAKIDTANAKRDEHLRGPDFFNAKQFPTMTFKSTGATRTAAGHDVTGELTIKGTTKSITIPLAKTGEVQAERLGHRVGYEATFTINRLDYGVDYMPDMLGKDVTVIVAVEAVKE